ncbi:MAG: isoprenylcysteine carboxylmethyltransferase family protein [Deltaproteobacteria bacterium]|nr:isoprenylcysteine carboxylmethyltransferase family protein [Deltaproteobacteria bacterium]
MSAEQPVAEASASPPGPRAVSLGRAVLRRLRLALLGSAFMGAVYFLCAGRLDLPAAWAFLALGLVAAVVNTVVLARRHPELIELRARPQPGTETSDLGLMKAAALLGPVLLVVCGLDAGRLRLVEIPLSVSLLALGVYAVSVALSNWAMAFNAHFESTVRLQAERGHRVETGGPYRFVRHPGYLAALIGLLAQPVVLGSILGFVPAVASAVLIVVRTAFEDRTLMGALEGYRAYAGRVRYRLVPGVF